MRTPRRLKVSIACLRLPLYSFIICGRSIVRALTNNPAFPDIGALLAVLDAALTDLTTKAQKAMNGDRIALAARDESWLNAGSILRQVASVVQAHCQNDLSILLSSGFVATKPRKKIGSLSAPENLRMSYTGKSGEVMLRIDKVHGARAGYLIQIAEDSTGPYTEYGYSTSSRILIKGLTPMSYYWVRVRAHGTAGPSAWSAPLRLTVI